MAHLFSQVPRAEIQRSSFNRDHTYKTAIDSNYLIPFYVDEVVPGDTFNLQAALFGRLSTPVVPIMDNLYLDTFFSSFRLVLFGIIGRSLMVNKKILVILQIILYLL